MCHWHTMAYTMADKSQLFPLTEKEEKYTKKPDIEIVRYKRRGQWRIECNYWERFSGYVYCISSGRPHRPIVKKEKKFVHAANYHFFPGAFSCACAFFLLYSLFLIIFDDVAASQLLIAHTHTR